MACVAFGPLRYRVEGDAPTFLTRYACDPTPEVPVLSFVRGAAPDGALSVRGASLVLTDEHRRVFVPPEADLDRLSNAPLAEVVARDLPGVGALMLHGSAVRSTAGAVALIGAPSVGKTTMARHDPARALAGNALCVWPGGEGWRGAALPFASDPDPSLDARGDFPVAAIVELRRGGAPTFEWLRGHRATMAVMKRIAAPPFDDPHRSRRATLGLDLATRVGVGSLAVTGDRVDLDLLDQSIHVSALP